MWLSLTNHAERQYLQSGRIEQVVADFGLNVPTDGLVTANVDYKGLSVSPSAKEVEKNGIFLGEMDAKLLQKIEELTLYTIQQEKKIEDQDEEIKKLKLAVGEF